MTDVDEETASDGYVRIQNLAQTEIITRGVEWQTNIGPHGREAGNNNGVPESANVVPTGGTWRAGQKLYDSSPSAAGSLGWICTVAGTPGTWVVFGEVGPTGLATTVTFTASDATPSVSGGKVFLTDSGTLTITDFHDGS